MRTHTTVIDGVSYETTNLPASEGLVILPKLIAIFGESLIGLLLTAADDDESKTAETLQALLSNPKVLAAMIDTIAQRAAEDDALLVVRRLMKTTTADKVRIGDAEVPGPVHTHFDGHFAGRYKHLFEVAFWVAKANFAAP